MKISKGIIVIPTMGFANRLRFLATAQITLSYLSNSFFIDWIECSGLKCKFNEIFSKISNYKIISKEEYINSNYLYFGYVHISEILSKLKESTGEYDYLIVTGGHQIITQPSLTFSWIQSKINFYNTIKWSEKINTKIDEFTALYKIDFNNTVAMHIRYIVEKFDAADIKHNILLDFNKNSPIEKFKEYITQIKKDKTIIVFTNSDHVKREIGGFSTNFTSNPRIIIPENNNYNRLDSEAILQSVIEFIVMSRCKMIIGTYLSSFSDEASYMRGIPKLIALSDTIKDNSEEFKNYINKYHSGNLQVIFNNLCINTNSKILLDFFTDLS